MSNGNLLGEAALSPTGRSSTPPVLEKLPCLSSLTLQPIGSILGSGSIGDGGASIVF